MAKKRAAQSTKNRQGRKTTPAKKTAPAKATDPAPVKKKPKARGKFTLDEAIKWFAKDPHPEEFFCTDAPGFALVQGDHYLKFNKGQLVTSDPAEVEVLMRSRQFNLFIYAVNPTLRNLK